MAGGADDGEALAIAIGHDHQIRGGLFEVIAGDRRHGGRVAGLERRLELRQVGDERGRACHTFEERRALLIDERDRFSQVALQFGFGLRGEHRAHEVHG